ncbi:MAG: nitrogen fixation protein NifQ [Candidatus Accumulibacter sp.]|jgi:nitrogen fixation protein NifQ|uniref:nitrogen fixation protein NifQ n=1 Tax=Accumulibacter sp. TaxID=2053492 RepID=UPI001AC90387|nr:nitrogen fixation protein NifQ [Accumulibacter sp.]MBN8437507.1 nitrogen fixation protein NifQ [Accumulibacter sp.]
MRPPAECRSNLMAELLNRPATAAAAADPLRPILSSLLAGRSLNEGVLPANLGLPADVFRRLWDDYFPGAALRLQGGGGEDIPELADLIELLLEYRGGQQESELWLARIVAFGCAGRDHLWQDLGLANRAELSALMEFAFPPLAALNTHDMKWKKFIYRQYCAREGIYVCPAPSCGECLDYKACFAPEE